MASLSEGRGRRGGGGRETPWHFLAAGARTNSSTLLGCHGKTAGPCGAVEAQDATILDLAGRLEVVDVRLREVVAVTVRSAFMVVTLAKLIASEFAGWKRVVGW